MTDELTVVLVVVVLMHLLVEQVFLVKDLLVEAHIRMTMVGAVVVGPLKWDLMAALLELRVLAVMGKCLLFLVRQ
jgi:hypothetical protein